MPTWTAPITFIAGAILTAAQLNVNLRDNTRVLRLQANALELDARNLGSRIDALEAEDLLQIARLEVLEADDIAIGERIDAVVEAGDAHEERLVAIELLNTQQTASIDELRSSASSLEDSRDTFQGNISTLGGQITTLEDAPPSGGGITPTALINRIITIESGISTGASTVSNLHGRVTTGTTHLSTTSGRLGTAEGEIDTLQSQVQMLQGDPGDAPGLTQLTARVATAEGEVVVLRGQISNNVPSLVSRITGIEGGINSLQIDVAALMNPQSPGDAALAGRISAVESGVSALETLVGSRQSSFFLEDRTVWGYLDIHEDLINDVSSTYLSRSQVQGMLGPLNAVVNNVRDHSSGDDLQDFRNHQAALNSWYHNFFIQRINQFIQTYNSNTTFADISEFPSSSIPAP